jgi:hypothetical protein
MGEVRQHQAIHDPASLMTPRTLTSSRHQPGTGILEPAGRTTLPSEGDATAEAEELQLDRYGPALCQDESAR